MAYLRWQNLTDFVVLAVALYPLLRWSQEAAARLDVFGARPWSGRPSFEAISTALFSLAAARRGALVVVARRDAVDEVASGDKAWPDGRYPGLHRLKLGTSLAC